MNILLVDDNKFILAVAKEYLEEIPGISSIFICNDPFKVKNILETNEIDILITDIVMPGLSGLDLLQMLREDDKYDDMPIIMITTLEDTKSYQKCFELGAFDYISKPINGIEFNSRLKVAIEAKRNSNHLKSLVEVTQKQNNELKEINAQLTSAKFQLVQSEKMAAIGQLASGIAHEINNPMGYINSNYEILHRYFNRLSEFLTFFNTCITEVKEGGNNEINRFVSRLEEKSSELRIDMLLKELDNILADSEIGIQRITEIVQSLRIFTRSAKDEEKAFYPLYDIINQVILISKNEFKYVARVEISVPRNIVLYCNRVQIGQVIVNIIVNAAQAIQSEKRSTLGLIIISAEQIDNNIIIRFENDGPDIPYENQLKIFEPFFTTKDVGQGTGLGLSISYDIIVNKHSGTIEVKSTPGKGVIFTITLPVKHLNN